MEKFFNEVEERLARKEDQMKQRRKHSTTAAKKAKAPRNVTRKTGRAQTEREKDENKCQGCYNRYDEDSPERQEAWVGCEACWPGFITTAGAYQDCQTKTNLGYVPPVAKCN